MTHRAQKPATLLAAVVALAALLCLALGAERATAATCPDFRVLHNDRIGPASLPAGSYTITTASTISCSEASRLFARFLQDWDGNLPRPWRVVARGTGKAEFLRGSAFGFSVARQGSGGGGGKNALGSLCPTPYTVNASKQVGPLYFPRGTYRLYLPSRTGITCNRAAVLFTRFLGQQAGRLPFPWRVLTQTATFYKPENPTRSAFRVERSY